MAEDFGEPWRFVDDNELIGGMPCVVTRENAVIHNGRFGLTHEQGA